MSDKSPLPSRPIPSKPKPRPNNLRSFVKGKSETCEIFLFKKGNTVENKQSVKPKVQMCQMTKIFELI